MRDPDEAAVRLYLLGLMPEADAEALEDAYFARPEVFDRVRAAEDDLLDDYAAGRLAPAERAAFEDRCRTSPALRERVMAARALRLAAAALRPARVVPWRGVARRTTPLAIAAGLVVAILTSWLWQSRGSQVVAPGPHPSVAHVERPTPAPTDSGSPSPGPSPSARPSASPSSAVPAMSRLVFALSPTLLRGEGGPVQVRIPSATDTVVLELQGDPTGVPRRAPLDASIETVEGDRVWSGPARRNDRPALVASVAVPADRLVPGDYLVTLSASGQTLYRYFFRVPAR